MILGKKVRRITAVFGIFQIRICDKKKKKCYFEKISPETYIFFSTARSSIFTFTILYFFAVVLSVPLSIRGMYIVHVLQIYPSAHQSRIRAPCGGSKAPAVGCASFFFFFFLAIQSLIPTLFILNYETIFINIMLGPLCEVNMEYSIKLRLYCTNVHYTVKPKLTRCPSSTASQLPYLRLRLHRQIQLRCFYPSECW